MDNVKVIKRNGELVPFDKTKIEKAVLAAFADVGEVDSYAKTKALNISNYIENEAVNSDEPLSVEVISDLAENGLMSTKSKKVAQAFVRYRYKHQLIREARTNLDYEILGLKDGSSEETKNNANKNGKLIQTLKPMISDVTVIDQAKRFFIPEKILKHHEKEIYIHDMNYCSLPLFNCCLVDWENCLEGGMTIGNAPIEKPNTITVAIALLSQIAAHVSSNCYGGITFTRMTKGLCQYGKGSLNFWRQDAENEGVADKEGYAWRHLEREIRKAVKGLQYEILTLTNSRGEIPFTTLELDAIDLNASEEDQKIQKLILTAFLEYRIEGLAGGVTPVFPKLCFELQRGNNLEPQDKYYDIFQLAVKCSSLRVYPDYLMHDRVVAVTGSYKAPMGCRSFPADIRDFEGNPHPQGSFNLGVCSINLPRLAIQAKGNEEKFYSLLDKYLELVKEMLLIRRQSLVGIQAKQAPILYQYGAIARLNPEDTIDCLLNKDKSSISIGYVGLHNALVALYGEGYDTKPELLEKGINLIKYLRNYCEKQKEETNIGFSLYGTPAEALATKFCRADVKEYGIIPGVNDKTYYENSFHYPSNEEVNPFDKIDLECQMSRFSNGGSIQYTEFGDMTHNTAALEQVIRYAYDKVHYFGVNTASDRCFSCGFVGQMDSIEPSTNHFRCPQCGNEDNAKMSVIRRICGYLGSLSERPTVDGKMREMSNRWHKSEKYTGEN